MAWSCAMHTASTAPAIARSRSRPVPPVASTCSCACTTSSVNGVTTRRRISAFDRKCE